MTHPGRSAEGAHRHGVIYTLVPVKELTAYRTWKDKIQDPKKVGSGEFETFDGSIPAVRDITTGMGASEMGMKRQYLVMEDFFHDKMRSVRRHENILRHEKREKRRDILSMFKYQKEKANDVHRRGKRDEDV